MKKYSYLLILAVLSACATPQQAESGIRSENRIIGIVELRQEDCGVVILANTEEKEEVFLPDNLDEKYRVEGMKLKFYYTRTGNAKGKCKAVPVVLEDVTIMR